MDPLILCDLKERKRMISVIRKAYIWTQIETISMAGVAEGVALAGGRN